MFRRNLLRSVVLFAVLVVFGACSEGGLGSGGGEDVSVDDTTTTTDGGGGDDSTTTTDGGGGGGGGDNEEFCSDLEDAMGSEDVPDRGDIEDILDRAPDEIQDDIEVILDHFDELEDLGGDPSEVSPELIEAFTNLGSFVASECGDGDFTDLPTDLPTDIPTDFTDGTDGGGGTPIDDLTPTPIPSDTPAELQSQAQACFDGDMQACDDLYFASDFGTAVEAWANTCGGRFDTSPGYCVDAVED